MERCEGNTARDRGETVASERTPAPISAPDEVLSVITRGSRPLHQAQRGNVTLRRLFAGTAVPRPRSGSTLGATQPSAFTVRDQPVIRAKDRQGGRYGRRGVRNLPHGAIRAARPSDGTPPGRRRRCFGGPARGRGAGAARAVWRRPARDLKRPTDASQTIRKETMMTEVTVDLTGKETGFDIVR